ncbi:TetR family transcriptional regulator [Cytobacillus firmus]|uniref:TetR family transcriptional regulator n=2 Tax=Cytobacillus TaxID=2675230 RepID=A0A366JG80_CYTFI|nr:MULTISPECIES: TetR/AcrR family transcriptional regulator [Cytobacillus]RBP85986.1 TetR family transcriptional regulator [Cytobacillus firmus]TDX35512.1 TetR family transcriptional regulator [Cytobacillus oceanisediminis]
MARKKEFDISQAAHKAADVFRKKGFEGTSMQDLVDVLNLSRSSIYETFGNKKELYLVALDHYTNEVDDLTSILYENGPPKTVLDKFFVKIIEHNELESCFMVQASLEMFTHLDVMDRVGRNNIKREKAFLFLLERALSNGEITENQNLSILSKYLVNVTNGLAVTSRSTDKSTLDQIVKMSLYFIK